MDNPAPKVIFGALSCFLGYISATLKQNGAGAMPIKARRGFREMQQFDKPATQASEKPGLSRRSRRARLLPNLLLAALLGCIVLLLMFWLSGGFSSFSLSGSDIPTISLGNAGPYSVGSLIRLDGQRFSHFAIIALLRDGQPATDGNGQRLAVNTDQNGTFSITLVITPDWGAGDHIISALDTVSQQRASVTIHVGSSKSYSLTSVPLASFAYSLARNRQ